MLLELPHTVETVQWGGNLVFWAGDKSIGGKMFALVDLAASHGYPISYAAGPERYHELLEREGFGPAPYFARAFWVAVQRWSSLRNAEWDDEFHLAHKLTMNKLPARTRAVLALPPRERARAIAARKKLLHERAK